MTSTKHVPSKFINVPAPHEVALRCSNGLPAVEPEPDSHIDPPAKTHFPVEGEQASLYNDVKRNGECVNTRDLHEASPRPKRSTASQRKRPPEDFFEPRRRKAHGKARGKPPEMRPSSRVRQPRRVDDDMIDTDAVIFDDEADFVPVCVALQQEESETANVRVTPRRSRREDGAGVGYDKERGASRSGLLKPSRAEGHDDWDASPPSAKRRRKDKTKAAYSPSCDHEDRDVMAGCSKCRFLRQGCKSCRALPSTYFSRPAARWCPEEGRPQFDVPNAPSFRPTAEEFMDPIAYITKIMPEAAKYGLAHIIPPEGWDPPFALEKGTNGMSMESFKFKIRRQQTSQLCYRSVPAKAHSVGGSTLAQGRYGQKSRSTGPEEALARKKQHGSHQGVDISTKERKYPCALSHQPGESHVGLESPADGVVMKIKPEDDPFETQQPGPSPLPDALGGDMPSEDGAGVQASSADKNDGDEEYGGERYALLADFGFVTLEKPQTLRSFATYADWAKALHFSDPPAQGSGTSSAPKKRPIRALPIQYTTPVEPSVEEIEAEFWRVVEAPYDRSSGKLQFEALYGQDLDSGHHGSGFPLPEWRRQLLERHLKATQNRLNPFAPEITLPPHSTDKERTYAEHPWNINNMPRCKSSVLRYLLGDGLITGVMVPWLYVGSCMSAFCWHIEDHALYSVNYMHMGAPKLWYGVPSSATTAMEEAMRDALPHLFNASPELLYQLVTMLSPTELRKRGVPVHRVVHEAGSFVVTMPNAYHAGFNTGFNCAEAVNFAAPGWIPYGTDVAQKYRDSRKPTTMSHDSLLVALATAAQHVKLPVMGKPGRRAPSPENGGDGLESDTNRKNSRKYANSNGIHQEGGPNFRQQGSPGDVRRSGRLAKDTSHDVKTGFGPLGDIPWQDAPLEGIILGTGELALRADEERQRWAAGLDGLGVSSLPHRAMDSDAGPGAKDGSGVYVNTAECDCAECNGDLWLAAVVSHEAPGVAVCPEHASALVNTHGCSIQSLCMLCRHSPDDLQALVDEAATRIDGVKAAIAAAFERRDRHEAGRVRSVALGPLYETVKGRLPRCHPRHTTATTRKQPAKSGRRRKVGSLSGPVERGAPAKKTRTNNDPSDGLANGNDDAEDELLVIA